MATGWLNYGAPSASREGRSVLSTHISEDFILPVLFPRKGLKQVNLIRNSNVPSFFFLNEVLANFHCAVTLRTVGTFIYWPNKEEHK